MKQTALGCSPYLYKKKLAAGFLGCGLLLVLTLGLNFLILSLRTDTNHTQLLWLNIGSDILCGCFLVYALTAVLLPRLRLYRLCIRPTTVFEGTVTALQQSPIRYMDLDCLPVTVGQRRLFLPLCPITLAEGSHYRLSVAGSLIVEAEI